MLFYTVKVKEWTVLSEMFNELTLPFSIDDLISSGSMLLKYVGPFLLLALAFILPKVIYGLIRHALWVNQATEHMDKERYRQLIRKEKIKMWSRHEVKHSIRMAFKNEWK